MVGVYDHGGYQPSGMVVGGFDPIAEGRLRVSLEGLPNVPRPADSSWSNDRIFWVDPRVVVSVKFSEWTSAGQLRFPIFAGIRLDVSPSECFKMSVIEAPASPAPAPSTLQPPRLPL